MTNLFVAFRKESNMSKRIKKDVISNREFTMINNSPKQGHIPFPDEKILEDENKDSFKEMLIGMEYDLDQAEDDWDEEEIKNLKMLRKEKL